MTTDSKETAWASMQENTEWQKQLDTLVKLKKPEEIWKELEKPENKIKVAEAIKWPLDKMISGIKSIENLTPENKNALVLYYKLNISSLEIPKDEDLFKTVKAMQEISSRNIPSENWNKLINDTKELLKDPIKNKDKLLRIIETTSFSKWDIKELLKDLESKELKEKLEKIWALKIFTKAFAESIGNNWYTIENEEDKKIITSLFPDKKKDIERLDIKDKKFIIRKDKDWKDISIKPLIDEKWVISDLVDIEKTNKFLWKETAANIAKWISWNTKDMTETFNRISDMLKNLSWWSKFMSAFLEIIWMLLWINKSSPKTEIKWWKEVKEDDKFWSEFITNMLDEKNKNYNIDNIKFDKWDLKEWTDDKSKKEIQNYLFDFQKLMKTDEKDNNWNLIYWEKTKKAVNDKTKEINNSISKFNEGKEDKDKAQKIDEKWEWDKKFLETYKKYINKEFEIKAKTEVSNVPKKDEKPQEQPKTQETPEKMKWKFKVWETVIVKWNKVNMRESWDDSYFEDKKAKKWEKFKVVDDNDITATMEMWKKEYNMIPVQKEWDSKIYYIAENYLQLPNEPKAKKKK